MIESCWAQNPSERPSFDDIVDLLKTDSSFITDKIRKNDFFSYIEFIDKSRKAFDSSKKILDLDEFIKEKSKIVESSINELDRKSSDESDNDSSQSINNNSSLACQVDIETTNTALKIDENESSVGIENENIMKKIDENESS